MKTAMKMNVVEVKNEKSFRNVSALYKAFFKKHEQMKIRDFHKYAFNKSISFKKFYFNHKFIGFYKGFYTDKFIYISWFAYIDEKYKLPILEKIKEINKNRDIIFLLRGKDELTFYLENGFEEPKLSKSLAVNGLPIVTNSIKTFNDQEVINGIKKNDWPLMFPSSFCSYVYYADVSNLNVDKVINKLPEIRRAKIERFKFDKDKKLSAGAWLLLEKAMKLHHININDYEIEVSLKGKPSLKDCPYEFSISHSGNYVLVGISKEPIGVDIQEMKPIDEDMLKMIGNDNDFDYYKTAENRLNAFYKIWTYKEAICKQTGEGLNTPLKDIRFDYLFSYNGKFLFEYDIPNYKIAVCSTVLQIKPLKEIKL